MDDAPAMSAASLHYGRPPLGPLRGTFAALARYGVCPVGAAVAVALIVLPNRDTMPGWLATVSTVVIAIAILTAFFGWVAIQSGIMWRLRGRMIRGVAFFTNEPEPLVQLNSRTRTHYRPLRDLRTIQVHRMSEWVSDYSESHDRDRPPWLRLEFHTPRNTSATRWRTTHYCLTPIHLNQAHAEAQLIADLRRTLAGTGVHIQDIHTEWRKRKTGESPKPEL